MVQERVTLKISRTNVKRELALERAKEGMLRERKLRKVEGKNVKRDHTLQS
jgi:hypothetical protein